MANRWQFLDATPSERALFPDLANTLQWASRRVAPPNRHREVVRIETPDGTYYLKLFHHTQLKNRFRNSLSAPQVTT